MKKIISFSIFFGGITLGLLGTVEATTTKIKPEQFKLTAPADEFSYMTDQAFAALKKAESKKTGQREPNARTDFSDPNVTFTHQYLNLQSKLIGGPIYDEKMQKTDKTEPGVSSADELAVLVDKANDKTYYDSLPTDAKFIVAALATLKPYRGLAFRARPLFSKNNLVHAYMISGLRMAASGINVFLPSRQWKAGFQYLSEPMAVKYRTLSNEIIGKFGATQEQRAIGYIRDELTFFIFVNYEVLPYLNTYVGRLKGLIAEAERPNFKPIYFDNQLVFSTTNFDNEHDRIIKLGLPELRLALANAMVSRSGIYASLSYSWTNLFKAIEGTARNFGFQSVFNVDLTTAEQRNIQLNQPGLFELQNPRNMGPAYESLKEAVRQNYLAWNEIKKAGNDKYSENEIVPLLDPRVLAPMRGIDASLSNITSLFDLPETGQGSKNIRSAIVQGESVEVDLYSFFHGESIPKDLKKFMPIDYVKGPREFRPGDRTYRESKLASIAGGPIRNYLEGSPEKWNIGVYQKYFPGIKSDKQVISAARILGQAWGGWIIGLPFSAMVL